MATRLSTNSYRKLKACSRHISQPKYRVFNQTSSAYNHLRHRSSSGNLLVLTSPHSIIGLYSDIRSVAGLVFSSLCWMNPLGCRRQERSGRCQWEAATNNCPDIGFSYQGSSEYEMGPPATRRYSDSFSTNELFYNSWNAVWCLLYMHYRVVYRQSTENSLQICRPTQ
jgi:hypothetical protein